MRMNWKSFKADVIIIPRFAEVAQLVEHPPEERSVVSSSLTLGTFLKDRINIWAVSSIGGAHGLHPWGYRFESYTAHCN